MLYPIVEQADNVHKLLRAAKLRHDLPERTSCTILLNHIHRFDPLIVQICKHCNRHRETVERLFQCRALTELRKDLIPNSPNIENCICSNTIKWYCPSVWMLLPHYGHIMIDIKFFLLVNVFKYTSLGVSGPKNKNFPKPEVSHKK